MKLWPIQALVALCSFLENSDFHCSAFTTIPWWFLCRTIHPGSPGRIPVLIIVFCPASFHFNLDCYYSALFPNPRCTTAGVISAQASSGNAAWHRVGATLLPLNLIRYFFSFSKGSLCEQLIMSCGNIWTGSALQLPGLERLQLLRCTDVEWAAVWCLDHRQNSCFFCPLAAPGNY